MPISFFVDKTRFPEDDEVEYILGEALPAWKRLVDFIASNYRMAGDMMYGGKNYGWNLWYRKSGKSLTSLYPQQNYFVAQVVLGRLQVEEALKLNLGANVNQVLRETPSLHDGRWLFIKVTNDSDVFDVERLLLIKKRPIRKKVYNSEA